MKKSKEIKLRNLIRNASGKEAISEITTSAASGKKVGRNVGRSRSNRRTSPDIGSKEEYIAEIPPGTTTAFPVGDTSGRGTRARITSRSGFRGRLKTTRGGAGGTDHGAYDFGCAVGTPIVAYADGDIVKTSTSGDGGNAITIRHGFSLPDGEGGKGQASTYYAHLSSFSKTSGRVKAGEVIGLSGQTGNVSGPHLHWAIYVNGKSVKNDSVYDSALANAVVIDQFNKSADEDQPGTERSGLAESIILKKSKSILESKISLSSFVSRKSGLSDLEKLIDLIVKEGLFKEQDLKTGAGKKIGGNSSSASQEDTEEDVTSAQGDAAQIARAEVSKWSGKDEDDEEMKSTLAAYAAEVGQGEDYFPGQPWSGGFVSWAKQNEPGFPKSAAHQTYMSHAKRNRDSGKETGQIAYKPSEEQPDPGDLVCRNREGSGDGWDDIGPMNHCDVFLGGSDMAGGNLEDTAKVVRYNPQRATMIIKNISEAYNLNEDEVIELKNILTEG